MSSKTVYGLLKEANELIEAAFLTLDYDERTKMFADSHNKIGTALKSLESDPNIYKVVRQNENK